MLGLGENARPVGLNLHAARVAPVTTRTYTEVSAMAWRWWVDERRAGATRERHASDARWRFRRESHSEKRVWGFDAADAQRGDLTCTDGAQKLVKRPACRFTAIGPCVALKSWTALRARMAKRLLLIEDEPTLARAMGRLLRRAGYEVFLAGDCAEARRASGTFSLGIFDIDLPDGDGVDLAAELIGSGLVRGESYSSVNAERRTGVQRAAGRKSGPFVEKGSGFPALRATT